MGMFLKEEFLTDSKMVDFSDCFGAYDRSSPICSKWCAMRLACCIEQDRMDREFSIEEEVELLAPMVIN